MRLLIVPESRNRLLKIVYRYIVSYIKHLLQLMSLLLVVDKRDIVIICGGLDQSWLFRYFSLKTNFVLERTEYPSSLIYEKIGRFNTFLTNQYLKNMKYADAFITCSSYLDNYYESYIKKQKTIIIPLVVDAAEFIKSDHSKKKLYGEYIAYCGSFDNNKDGLPILLESFNIFHKNHPSVKLVLIGAGSKNNMDKFKESVFKYGIEDSVMFTGLLPHEEMGGWLAGATMLALARPNNKQAEGGIPSKVGEYLASGVPCVITRTGDLPGYLKDGVDCFLCTPDSSESYANRLEDCYKSNREEVGAHGRATAISLFSYKYQAERLISFFNETFHLDLEGK